MESNVKSLTITGTAAEDATRFRQKGSRRKRVKDQEEEVPSDSQFIEQVKKISLVKVAPVTHAVTQNSQATHSQSHAQQTQAPMKPQVQQLQVQHTQVQQPQAQQPQAPSNVILKPLKQPRVKLQPKSIHAAAASRPIDTTRKARRIHLSVGNLNHRFTRAKRLKDDTEKKPMSSIREYLVGKGVIQQKSKAPEKMLRSMYSDFMLLKDQAL
jgi:hypothetical protein